MAQQGIAPGAGPIVTPARWQRIQSLVESAITLEEPARTEYLRAECGGDEELHSEVLTILESYEADDSRLSDAVGAVAAEFLATKNVAPGDLVGSWRIERVLGRGGMGTVYLASRADDQFRHMAAIKVMHREFGQAPELVTRFRAERQILANLSHPNIARLLDGGITEAGAPYLVMEYVEGKPLDQHIASARPAIRDRLRLFRDLCAAVQYAHQNLIVHRDLKPANVLVTADGVPMLLDFGIAKLLGAADAGITQALTRPAERLMTPEYASPEQIRGETITTATDVYGLGVILYELLAEKRPFDITGLSPAAVERLICQTAPAAPQCDSGQQHSQRPAARIAARVGQHCAEGDAQRSRAPLCIRERVCAGY